MGYQDPEDGRRWYRANRRRVLAQVHAYYLANRTKILAQKRAYREANRDEINARKRARHDPAAQRAYREIHRERDRRNRYGLSAADLAAVQAKQSELCAICRRNVRLTIDHDHQTGRVRGLLCRSCNIGLGNFEDDPERLREAIKYLGAA